MNFGGHRSRGVISTRRRIRRRKKGKKRDFCGNFRGAENERSQQVSAFAEAASQLGAANKRLCVIGLGTGVPALAAAAAGGRVTWIDCVPRYVEAAGPPPKNVGFGNTTWHARKSLPNRKKNC